jgi:hypothetical protein
MWLEKFVFCGKSIGPTSNYQIVSELLVTGNHILLGIHLLGAIYNLLHHVSVNFRLANLYAAWEVLGGLSTCG